MGRVERVMLLVVVSFMAMGCYTMRATEKERQEEAARAQQTVRFGRHVVRLELNVLDSNKKRQKEYAAALGQGVNGKLNVLMQFARTPDAEMREKLAKRAVELGSYVGGNAYYAQVGEGSRPCDFAEAGAIAVVAIAPEWKVSDLLTGEKVPEWADRGNGRVEVVFSWFPNVDVRFVEAYIARQGYVLSYISKPFSNAAITLPQVEVMRLAAESWVQHVGPVAPPMDLFNQSGRASRPNDPRGVEQPRPSVKDIKP